MNESAIIWRIEVRIPRHAVAAMEEALEAGFPGIATSSFEIGDGEEWLVQTLLPHAPETATLKSVLAQAATAAGIGEPSALVEPLPETDWVAETQKQLAPLRIGRFHIHGSHDAPARSPSLIDLTIDAGRAFGTGRHHSTQGCLIALEALARRRHFLRILDMGCGSGVLSLAAASLWRDAAILAVDSDRHSVAATRENAVVNGVADRLDVWPSHGFSSRHVANHAPYDLILANILARPLVRMAPDMARVMTPGGSAVLSGLLETQEALVLWAYRTQGFWLERRIAREGWLTLALRYRGRKIENG